MGFWKNIFAETIDDRLDDVIGASNKASLTVHGTDFPDYRMVDLHNAVDAFVSERDGVVALEVEQSETLNDILHSKKPEWVDRKLGKATKRPWQTGPDSERYLSIDKFWLCPSPRHGERLVLRVRLDVFNAKVVFEVACADPTAPIEWIVRRANEASIFRGSIVHLSHQPGKRDDYGDVEQAESLQVVFSKVAPVEDDDIILGSDQLQLIQRNIIDLHERRAFLDFNGVPTRRGVLLFGPPGTGKTYVCRYVCHRLRTVTRIFGTGTTLARVSSLFSLARLLQPSILFIEDADLMFASREANMHSTTLGELMDQLDGLRPNENVSVVFTTNDLDRMEAALKDRPGRISQCIYMGAPDAGLRERYIRHQLGRFDLASVDLAALVERSDGTTQAFLKEWLYRSIQIACERLREPDQHAELENGDFARAMSEMKRSLGDSGRNIIGFTSNFR